VFICSLACSLACSPGTESYIWHMFIWPRVADGHSFDQWATRMSKAIDISSNWSRLFRWGLECLANCTENQWLHLYFPELVCLFSITLLMLSYLSFVQLQLSSYRVSITLTDIHSGDTITLALTKRQTLKQVFYVIIVICNDSNHRRYCLK